MYDEEKVVNKLETLVSIINHVGTKRSFVYFHHLTGDLEAAFLSGERATDITTKDLHATDKLGFSPDCWGRSCVAYHSRSRMLSFALAIPHIVRDKETCTRSYDENSRSTVQNDP